MHKIGMLQGEVVGLKKRKEELIADLAEQSSKRSEAEATLARWRTELEILSQQTSHNICFDLVPTLLRNTIGFTEKFPDPKTMTRSEMEAGCRATQDATFKPV